MISPGKISPIQELFFLILVGFWLVKSYLELRSLQSPNLTLGFQKKDLPDSQMLEVSYQ